MASFSRLAVQNRVRWLRQRVTSSARLLSGRLRSVPRFFMLNLWFIIGIAMVFATYRQDLRSSHDFALCW